MRNGEARTYSTVKELAQICHDDRLSAGVDRSPSSPQTANAHYPSLSTGLRNGARAVVKECFNGGVVDEMVTGVLQGRQGVLLPFLHDYMRRTLCRATGGASVASGCAGVLC